MIALVVTNDVRSNSLNLADNWDDLGHGGLLFSFLDYDLFTKYLSKFWLRRRGFVAIAALSNSTIARALAASSSSESYTDFPSCVMASLTAMLSADCRP